MTTRRRLTPETRALVEQAIARTGGELSNTFLMSAYGITYRQLQDIKTRMAATWQGIVA